MNESFTSHDFSATAPVLKRWFSDPILRIIPISLSPNALSITGGICALMAIAILWTTLDMLPWRPFSDSLGFSIAALLLVLYAICDQLDGLQARRRKTSNPYGDFLDHWIDAIIANLGPAPLCFIVGLGPVQVLLFSAITGLAWWANNWETRNRNSRKLPFLGGLEFIWVGVLILLVSVIFGRDAWSLGMGILNFGSILLVVVTSILIFSIFSSIKNNLAHIRDFITPVVSALPLTLWLLLRASNLTIIDLPIALGLIVLGIIFARHSGDLMRHLWLANHMPGFDRMVVAAGLILLVDQYFFQAMSNSGVTTFVLLLVLIYCLSRLLWQSMHTYFAMNYMADENQLGMSIVAPKPVTSKPRIMVDMSATILHHGHIRLLEQASVLGDVVVGLTSDAEIKKHKGFRSELDFDSRQEVIQSIRWVDDVVETPWLITDEVLERHQIDYLVHGEDNANDVVSSKLKILPRTKNISSRMIRENILKNS